MQAHSESSTEVLKEEHKVIERMLKVLSVACEKLEKNQEVPQEIFKKAIDFIRNFADSCHHGKEETAMFSLIEQRGIPKQGPTGVMRIEHEQGRSFVKALAEAVQRYEKGDRKAKTSIIENAQGYVTLLTQHIYKENHILYPLADSVLTASDHKELIEKFEEIERNRIGEGKHRECIRLVEELEKQLGIN